MRRTSALAVALLLGITSSAFAAAAPDFNPYAVKKDYPYKDDLMACNKMEAILTKYVEEHGIAPATAAEDAVVEHAAVVKYGSGRFTIDGERHSHCYALVVYPGGQKEVIIFRRLKDSPEAAEQIASGQWTTYSRPAD